MKSNKLLRVFVNQILILNQLRYQDFWFCGSMIYIYMLLNEGEGKDKELLRIKYIEFLLYDSLVRENLRIAIRGNK